MVNVIGFLTAQVYFSQASGSSHLQTQMFWEIFTFNPKMIAPSKWLELGLGLLKKLH